MRSAALSRLIVDIDYQGYDGGLIGDEIDEMFTEDVDFSIVQDCPSVNLGLPGGGGDRFGKLPPEPLLWSKKQHRPGPWRGAGVRKGSVKQSPVWVRPVGPAPLPPPKVRRSRKTVPRPVIAPKDQAIRTLMHDLIEAGYFKVYVADNEYRWHGPHD